MFEDVRIAIPFNEIIVLEQYLLEFIKVQIAK